MRREFALSSAGLGAAFEFISETVALRGGDASLARRLSVIVDEICGNLIRHDGSLTEAHRFTLELKDGADGNNAGVVLVICDPGRPFDPTGQRPVEQRSVGQHADTDADTDAYPDALGGYGLELVRGLSSGVSYERAGGCNRLTVSVAGSGAVGG